MTSQRRYSFAEYLSNVLKGENNFIPSFEARISMHLEDCHTDVAIIVNNIRSLCNKMPNYDNMISFVLYQITDGALSLFFRSSLKSFSLLSRRRL